MAKKKKKEVEDFDFNEAFEDEMDLEDFEDDDDEFDDEFDDDDFEEEEEHEDEDEEEDDDEFVASDLISEVVSKTTAKILSENLGVAQLGDLTSVTTKQLSSVKGVGKKKLTPLLEAAEEAGVEIGSDVSTDTVTKTKKKKVTTKTVQEVVASNGQANFLGGKGRGSKRFMPQLVVKRSVSELTLPETLLRSVDEQLVLSLVRSIQKVGIFNPLFIEEDGTIIDGAHRFTAIQELGSPWDNEVPCFIRPPDSQVSTEHMMIIANTARNEVDPITVAKCIQQLLDDGVFKSQGAVAQYLGATGKKFSRLGINKFMKLLSLDEDIQDLLKTNGVGWSVAYECADLRLDDLPLGLTREKFMKSLANGQMTKNKIRKLGRIQRGEEEVKTTEPRSIFRRVDHEDIPNGVVVTVSDTEVRVTAVVPHEGKFAKNFNVVTQAEKVLGNFDKPGGINSTLNDVRTGKVNPLAKKSVKTKKKKKAKAKATA